MDKLIEFLEATKYRNFDEDKLDMFEGFHLMELLDQSGLEDDEAVELLREYNPTLLKEEHR